MVDFIFYSILISGGFLVPFLPFLIDQKKVSHKIQTILAISIGILYVWFLLWLACTNKPAIELIELFSEFLIGDFSNFDYCLTTNIWRWIKGIGGFVLGMGGIWGFAILILYLSSYTDNKK